MKLSSIISLDNLEKLDLHGHDRDYAIMLVNQFIDDMLKMKKANFVIIHGVGEGILKKATHDTLRKHKRVLDFKIYYYNAGSTVVELDLKGL